MQKVVNIGDTKLVIKGHKHEIQESINYLLYTMHTWEKEELTIGHVAQCCSLFAIHS